MEVALNTHNTQHTLQIDLPDDQVIIARSKNPSSSGGWREVVAQSIHSPIDADPIRSRKLQGRKIAVITDDWGRPTPAAEVLPLILEELHSAGADSSMITFVTASGMHAPMSPEDLERKLGPDIVRNYRCISHDGGDWSNLAFCGISPLGTPIWINRYVAEADYKVAMGRIYLHEAYGYEGGYKMILPGVSGFDSITRDHSLNFSADCVPGNHCNPARREADAVGQIVGIDFLINVVVNRNSEPLKAFCGEPMSVHSHGVSWGDHEVWGAEVGTNADITVVSPYNLETLYRAASVTSEGGLIIALCANDSVFDESEGTASADESVCSLEQAAFRSALTTLAFPELLKLHEKRNWNLGEREVQYRIKAVRGEFYRRRRIQEIRKRRAVLTADPDTALRKALDGRQDARVIVIPDAVTTLAKERLL